MDHPLQPVVALLAIAISVFNLITYLWLGLTVLLIGNRRSAVTWIGGVGLLLAALFFLCHGALVGAGVPAGASPTDVWWHLSWVPGFAAPIFWAATGLHYVGLAGAWRRWRLPLLIAVAIPGGVAALLALANWPVIGHYGDFVRLLGDSLRLHGPAQQLPAAASPALPALGIVFIIYVAACACLPWLSLVLRRPLPSPGISARTSSTDTWLLWDAADAWSRARRALLGASICMMCAGGVAALIGILTSLAEHNALLNTVSPAFPLGVLPPPSPPGHMPLVLVAADLAVQVCLAGLGLQIGWAVVRQGVLIERRLPQRGFFSHWRGTVLVASLLAAVVAWMAAVNSESLPYLLVLVALVTTTYALFTRQAYGEHDRLLAQLRPFIASLAVGHAGWLTTDPAEVERNVEALFTSLCRDVLEASRGTLSLSAGHLHRIVTYRSPAAIAEGPDDAREWALPISDERGVVAQLVLGPRADGAGYTSADLEVARACGQRILDAVGEFAAAQAVASLARRRGLESELSAALPRRVLHDDVLPRLHLAMLRLEALRGRAGVSAPAAAAAAVSAGVASSIGADRANGTDRTDSTDRTDGGESPDLRADLGEVVNELGRAHHDLAALMRSAPAANPRRLEHGLVAVLRASLDGEFRGTFDSLEWEAPEDARQAADALPSIVAELLLGAAQEAVRNAGRHARGDDLHRRLTLRLVLAADARWVAITVADDGVGLQNEAARGGRDVPVVGVGDSGTNFPVPTSQTSSTRSGLLTYGALIALVGGTLSVKSGPQRGTIVTVRVPRTSEATTALGPADAP